VLHAPKIRVYVHATCYSSYSLVKYLIGKGLTGGINIVDVSRASEVDGAILSVPWVKLGSTVAAADPVSGEEVEAMIQGSYTPNIRDPLESFIKTLLASSYASSIAFLHGDLGYAAFRELAEASLRAPFTNQDVTGLVETVKRDGKGLYEELEFKLAKVIAINYVRDLYWASGGTLDSEGLERRVDETSILAWLIAKAGVGRVGLPGNPLVAINREGVKLLSSILESEGSKILAGVRREQEAILGDVAYISFLEVLGFRIKA